MCWARNLKLVWSGGRFLAVLQGIVVLISVEKVCQKVNHQYQGQMSADQRLVRDELTWQRMFNLWLHAFVVP